MKLKNKLLPLVGVAAVCATAAPIALTSCKANNSGWIDLMEKYNPTVKALDNQTLTTEKANEEYFGKEGSWKSDDEVMKTFIDDYLWSTYKYGDIKMMGGKFAEVKGQITDFAIAHQTYTSRTGTSYEIPTFTFKIKFIGKYEYSGSGQGYSYDYDFSGTYVNIPYAVEYDDIPDSSDEAWRVTPSSKILSDNEDTRCLAWSGKETLNYTYTYYDEKEGVEQTTTDTTEHDCFAGGYNYYQLLYSSYAPKYAVSHYLFSVQNGDKK